MNVRPQHHRRATQPPRCRVGTWATSVTRSVTDVPHVSTQRLPAASASRHAGKLATRSVSWRDSGVLGTFVGVMFERIVLSSICLAVIVWQVGAALSPGVAPAATRTLAEVPRNAPIGAYGGWVAWSVWSPERGRWRLSALHDGAIVEPPAPVRKHPFDLDLGSDANGRVVATYSRCTKTAQLPADFIGSPHRGCHVRVLDLLTGVERSAGIPRPANASDTMPSMWRGRVAFGRSVKGSDVDQVLLWDPTTRRLRRLKRGAVPPDVCDWNDDEPCTKVGGVGHVSALDLGSRLVAFRWTVSGTRIVGHSASEMRASTLDGRRTFKLADGWVYEACDEVDSVTTLSLGPPTVDGGAVFFATDAQRCSNSLVKLVRTRVDPFASAAARIPGNRLKGGISQVVRSGRRIYALFGRQVTVDRDADCPCALKEVAVSGLPGLG